MANKVYTFDDPNNYDFDSSKIEVADGKARLKATPDFDGLVGYWKFEDDVLDSSGQGNHGTNYGATFVDGKVDRCLSFDGVDDYVDCGSDSSLDITGDIAISLWVKASENWDPSHGHYHVILGKDDDNNGYRITVYEDSNTNKVYLEFFTENSGVKSGSNMYEIPITWAVDEWKHIGAVRDGSFLRLYIDGIEVATAPDNAPGSSPNNLYIGFSPRGFPSFKRFRGNIDEVAIYNRALSETEIQSHYNNGLGRHLSKYPTDKPTIKPKQSWVVSGLSKFIGFTETLGAGDGGGELSLSVIR